MSVSLQDLRRIEPVAPGPGAIWWRVAPVGRSRPCWLALLLPADDEPRAARLADAWMARAARTAGLSHPAIAGVHGIGHVNGVPAVLWDVIGGVPLDAIADGPIPQACAIDLTRKLARALHAAWDRTPSGGGEPPRVLHGDLAPSFVFLAPGGQVKLLGLGADPDAPSRGADPVRVSLPSPTPFAAPEAHSGRIVHGTDVYAAAAILAFLLTGRPPPSAETRLDWHQAAVAGLAEELRELPGGPRLAELVAWAMSFDPEARPTAAEMEGWLDDLRGAVDGPRLADWGDALLPGRAAALVASLGGPVAQGVAPDADADATDGLRAADPPASAAALPPVAPARPQGLRIAEASPPGSAVGAAAPVPASAPVVAPVSAPVFAAAAAPADGPAPRAPRTLTDLDARAVILSAELPDAVDAIAFIAPSVEQLRAARETVGPSARRALEMLNGGPSTRPAEDQPEAPPPPRGGPDLRARPATMPDLRARAGAPPDLRARVASAEAERRRRTLLGGGFAALALAALAGALLFSRVGPGPAASPVADLPPAGASPSTLDAPPAEPPPAEPPPAEPPPAVAAAPAPPAVAPPPPPAAPQRPAPASPPPRAVAKAAPARPAAPAPTPAATPVEAPAPAAPAAPSTGGVEVRGDAMSVDLVGEAGAVSPGPALAPGVYRLRVVFGAGDEPLYVGSVTVAPGRTSTVTCKSAFLRCSVQ